MISTPAEPCRLEQRLAAIASRLASCSTSTARDALAIEEIYFGRNVRSAFAVGQARGAVLAAAGGRDVPCFSYTPQAVKLAVCGSGAAGKDQVQRMVGALLSLPAPPASDHAADALALAICHSFRATAGELATPNRQPIQGGVRGLAQNPNT